MNALKLFGNRYFLKHEYLSLVVSILEYYGTETACYITVFGFELKWSFLPFSFLMDCINVQEQFICSFSSLIRLSAPLITDIFMKLEKYCWGTSGYCLISSVFEICCTLKKPEVRILPCLWKIWRGYWTN